MMWSLYQSATIGILAMMILFWGISIKIKDASIIDRIWGLGYVVLATIGLAHVDDLHWRQICLFLMVTIWGLRLSIYIHLRNRNHPEDYRYQEMRQKWGNRFWFVSLVTVFLFQGLLVLIIGAPVLLMFSTQGPDYITFTDIVGIVIWCVGFAFEAGGDFQLSRFKKNLANKGRLLNTGFWSVTRHPNYFGDSLQWWGFFLLVATLPWGYVTVFSPLVMTFLLTRVSGVAMLEKSLKSNKPGYDEYIRTVPPFFPDMRLWK